jgi:processive 1,2-diacylglycerol beta-glucosyltransferase
VSFRPVPAHEAVAARPPAVAAGGVATRAALLSGSIGGGHDALAAACSAVLEQAGAATHTFDVIGGLGERTGPARAADWVFRQLLASSPAYDAFHFSQLREGTRMVSAAERAGVGRATPVIGRQLRDAFGAEPVDLAVSVFATAAGVAARLKEAGHVRRSVVFLPDSTAHRMWVHEATDLFLVTSRLGAASVRRYRPDAPVEVLPPPLRPEFTRPPPRAAARVALGLPPGGEVVLLMGGAWGLGPVVELAARLADGGRHVIAVAGRNGTLLSRLRAAGATRPRLRPVGFSDGVAELMAAADLVVTTAGMTCFEARAVGRGLVLLDVVPGHGRENLAHELELGAAAVSQPDAATVTRAVDACLASGEFRDPLPVDASGAGALFLDALASLGALPRAGGGWLAGAAPAGGPGPGGDAGLDGAADSRDADGPDADGPDADGDAAGVRPGGLLRRSTDRPPRPARLA